MAITPQSLDYNLLAGMTQEEAIAYLMQQYGPEVLGQFMSQAYPQNYLPEVNDSPLLFAGDTQVSGFKPGSTSPYYGYEVEQQPGTNTYYRPLTDRFDPSGGGAYGNYVGVYDSQGNLVDVQFQQQDRDAGFFGENMDKVALGIIGAGLGGAFGGDSLFSSIANAGPGSGMGFVDPTANMPIGGPDLGMVTPEVAGNVGYQAATAAGASPTAAASAGDAVKAAVAAGKPLVDAIKTVGTALGIPGLLSAAGSILSDPGKLASLAGGAISAFGGANIASNYKDAVRGFAGDQAATGQQRADAITGAGQTAAGRFQDYGTAARNEFSNLAQGVSDRYAGVGSQAQGAYTTLGSNLAGQYSNIANQAKSMLGEFKPYALSTTLGSTDAQGNFRLNPQNQAVSDAALGVAQKSYDAAGAFDLDKIREQEYGLMQRIYAPEDEQKRLALEAREIAQGRGNLQSFSDANSTMFTDPDTGQQYRVGANPRDVAFQKGLLSRDLQSYLTADESAMARRGGLITQGGAAMQTPINYANFGLDLTRTGADIGRTAFDTQLSGANLWSGLAGRGVDAYGRAISSGIDAATQAGLAGTGAYQTLASRGAELGTGSMLSGVQALNTADAAAINAKYDAIDQSLKTKFGGETEALRMMAKLYASLGGSVASLGNTANPSKAMFDSMIRYYMSQGKTADEATKILDQALNNADIGGDIGIIPPPGGVSDPYDSYYDSMFGNY